MVASDVAQLSKLLDTDDERSRNLGFGPLLPLRGAMVQRYLFPSGVGGSRQFSVLSRYLSPSWSIMSSIAAPRWPMQNRHS